MALSVDPGAQLPGSVYFYFLVVQEFELRALHLQSRRSTA
jgi:hypothetical protein